MTVEGHRLYAVPSRPARKTVTVRPLLLDLFCGAGGAAIGYHRAGFDVIGVDIHRQPRYPFPFVQADVFDVFDGLAQAADVIHASPPCQAYSPLRTVWARRTWPDLIAPTRELLRGSGLPYVIENVPGAPLDNAVTLCGGGFMPVVECDDGVHRQLRRHRRFETNWPLLVPPCWHPYPALGVYGKGQWSNDNSPRRGGYQGSEREKLAAMGLSGFRQRELTEAIPPAFSHYIGERLAEHLAHRLTPAP